jgi:3-mercaptopyruvate sulfurtransferase SseA
MEQGVTDVAALLGGLSGWQRAGYPLVGDLVVTPAPEPTVAGEEMTPEPGTAGSAGAPVTMIEYSDYQ